MRPFRPIAVDLFAGAGGMSLGFEQAGFDVLVAVDSDPIHCATHAYNFPGTTVFCESVTNLRGDDLRGRSAICDREIDVVFGGPPCQGFSLMGKRSISDPRNSLLEHFLRLILELKPKYFVMENVPGMLVGDHRQFLDQMIDQLVKHHYQVDANAPILNAVDFGIPQKRKRLFLLGSRKDLPQPHYPTPTHHLPTGQRLSRLLPAPPTVEEAIADLPNASEYPELLTQDWIKADFRKPSRYAETLHNPLIAVDDYSHPRSYDPQLLTASILTRHSQATVNRFNSLANGRVDPITHFYKLAADGVCNTIRAGTDRERGAFTSPRPIHYAYPRCITVREAARLHSYPDWFRFHVTKWHGFRQVGNSVPPRLANAIAKEILNALTVTPLRPTLSHLPQDERLLKLKPNQAHKYYQSKMI